MTLSKATQFAADAAAVILCVAVAVQLLRHPTPTTSAIEERSRVVAGSYQPGDTVPLLPGMDFGSADRTLLIVTKSSCSFCRASYPFYQRLLAERDRTGKPVRIVFLSPADDRTESIELVRAHGLKPDAQVSYAPRDLRVRVTPTLLLVDRRGHVLDVWFGQAEPVDEVDIQSKLFQ